MKKNILTLLVVAGIAAGAYFLIELINSTQPKAQREAATKKTAMLVEVQKVSRGTYHPKIEGLGTVEAAQDISLSPRVNGRVVEISENFIPGGFVTKGEVLLRIDPADYENLVQERKSALEQAQADLNIELGRQEVAKKEYDLLNQNLSEANKSLVLREPQLAAAKAQVKAVTSMLNQAQLELERTSVIAPFDAQILSRSVNVGSEIDTNMTLARLVGVNEYWVIASIPVANLGRIQFPKEEIQGSEVVIRHRTAWPKEAVRTGQVQHLIGALDAQTRLARVLVSVKDPLVRLTETSGPQMLVGSIVQVEIAGSPLENIFRINRDYLREGDRLWLKRDGKLVITQADVIFRDKDFAYLGDGIGDGDLLITSNLSTVAQGLPLRTEGERGE